MGEGLVVTTEEIADLAVVRVDGELDLATAPALVEVLERLVERDDRPIVIDLSACGFVDSRGSRALALTARDADGPQIGIVCPQENRSVRRVLELVGIADLLKVHDSLDGFLSERP